MGNEEEVEEEKEHTGTEYSAESKEDWALRTPELLMCTFMYIYGKRRIETMRRTSRRQNESKRRENRRSHVFKEYFKAEEGRAGDELTELKTSRPRERRGNSDGNNGTRKLK